MRREHIDGTPKKKGEKEKMKMTKVKDLNSYEQSTAKQVLDRWAEDNGIVNAGIEEMKNFVTAKISEGYLQRLCKDGKMPDSFFRHTYRAMKDYGMDSYGSQRWAWLNTLFGYDIGADRAKAISDWYEENGLDVLDICAEDKGTLSNIIGMELGLHVSFSAFPDETPDHISYEWPDRLPAKNIYRVPFAYQRYGRIEVEAESREEAIRFAEEKLKDMSLSEMEQLSDYLEDSEEIDYEGVITDEYGNEVE